MSSLSTQPPQRTSSRPMSSSVVIPSSMGTRWDARAACCPPRVAPWWPSPEQVIAWRLTHKLLRRRPTYQAVVLSDNRDAARFHAERLSAVAVGSDERVKLVATCLEPGR